MNRLNLVSSIFALSSAAACGGSSTPTPVDPDTAPVASVDRFSDAFATLFKRSAPAFDSTVIQPMIPAANAPIDFDALFTVKAIGPTGDALTYYSFDIVPPTAVDGYVLVDASGAAIANQLPIIDKIPGDTGYTDFARITNVSVAAGYVANTIISVDDVMAAVADGSATLAPTTTIQDWTVVPAGSTATKHFNGKDPTGHRAWYNGQVANFMLFDEALAAGSDGAIPTSPIIVIFHNNMSPAEGFETDSTGMTHNVVATEPSDPGYSSYWNHSVGALSGFANVHDFASATANIMASDVGVIVNCPVVVAPVVSSRTSIRAPVLRAPSFVAWRPEHVARHSRGREARATLVHSVQAIGGIPSQGRRTTISISTLISGL